MILGREKSKLPKLNDIKVRPPHRKNKRRNTVVAPHFHFVSVGQGPRCMVDPFRKQTNR